MLGYLPRRSPRAVRDHPLTHRTGGGTGPPVSAQSRPPQQTPGRTPCPPPPSARRRPATPPPTPATKSYRLLQLHAFSPPREPPGSSRMFHNVPRAHSCKTKQSHVPVWHTRPSSASSHPASHTKHAKPRQSAPNHATTQNAQNEPTAPQKPTPRHTAPQLRAPAQNEPTQSAIPNPQPANPPCSSHLPSPSL